MIHLDTSFLVDLLRESSKAEHGPAHELLGELHDREVRISVFAAAELYSGAELADNAEAERAQVEKLCAAVEIAYPDEHFAPAYGRTLAPLHRAGEMIASMDLLIATSAIVDRAPLVTANRRHFARIAGLDLVSY